MVLLFDLRDDLDVDRDEFLAFLDDACGLRGQVVGDLSVYDCVGRVDVQFKTFVAELLREFAGVDQVAHGARVSRKLHIEVWLRRVARR